MTPLPIDPHVPDVVRAVDGFGAAVVVAPPGAGKTTRVPPALLDPGPLVLLQPRRIAARAIAERIAAEQGFRVGEAVGWQVRFERRATAATRLLVVTEGILTRQLIDDPLLARWTTVVIDEFHERSQHADLALAFLQKAREARPKLRVVVMSATLDPAPVAAFLGGCPVVEAPGRAFPVAIEHAPGVTPAEGARRALARGAGHVLVFLPGAPEIRRTAEALTSLPSDVRVLPLHGSLAPDEQAAALGPFDGRKLILATNVAETSLTIDGVTDVVDAGLHKLLRHDPGTGLDRLQTERIGADSAAQRAGRAGRTGPGRALRLWDERDRLPAAREPELARVDLAGPLLDIAAWGGDPRAFDWFDPPPEASRERGLELLERLGALRGSRLTPLGQHMQRLPLHPRLARLLLADGGSARAAAAVALLSETRVPRATGETTVSDLLVLADRVRDAPAHVRSAVRQLQQLAAPTGGAHDDTTFLKAVLAAWPDRVARRREPGSERLQLASGIGGRQARESGVRSSWLVAVDVELGPRGERSEALVRLASAIEPEWLQADHSETVHALHGPQVRATTREMYGELLLAERAAPVDPEVAAVLLRDELARRGTGAANEAVAQRLRFAGIDVDIGQLVADACQGRTSLPEIDLLALLPFDVRRELDRLAPARLDLPSGRTTSLDYRDDGTVVASVKLQELFGLAESPRLGPRREPVTFALLAPNGRPVQVTRDLASFWRTTYADVRRELRGRYPKHPWPEDPSTATPTHRTKR